MKKILFFDLLIQVLIAFVLLLFLLLAGDFLYLSCLVVLGAWQLLSACTHLLLKNPAKRGELRTVHLLISLALLLLGLHSPFLLLLGSPILAVCYFCIGIAEYRSHAFHTLIHLKN